MINDINRIVYGLMLCLTISSLSYGQTLDVQYLNPQLGNGSQYKYIRFGTEQDYKAGFMWNNTSDIYGDGDDFSILTYGSRDITLRPGSGNVIMFPSSGGKVGIGTQDPIGKVQINHTGTFSSKWVPEKSFFTITDGTSTLIMDTNEIYGSGTLFFGSRYGDVARFRTITETGYSDKMIIKENGNVGIGTITPDSKLSVNGKIHTKEVKVGLTGWPDYVFTDNYDLSTLQEVEHYIKTQGHLPNIPSATEVEKRRAYYLEKSIKNFLKK